MATVKKSFKGNTEDFIGAVNFCSWERLKPHLEHLCGLKPNEEIKGLRATEDGINITIWYKDGQS